jgi:protein-S-isoprenylcysteine O-methyltransferase Ste14
MNRPTLIFIGFCWLAWLIYWVRMAFSAKRTVERGGFFAYRLVGGAVLVSLVVAGHLLHIAAHSHLWHTSLGLGIVTDVVVAAGAAFTVWARVTLAGNWSAEVTFKADHELIESGPYALVRHPIYTGLLAMALGAVVNYGEPLGFAVFATVCAALWWKARLEEQIMSRHFADAYADYKQRVRAIIPFVL